MESCVLQLCYSVHKVYSHLKVFCLISPDTTYKFNFKIYDVTDWLTNNYNTYITQYLTKQRQQDKEIWSVNTI